LHHPTKIGRVVIPMHRGDLRTGTIQSAIEQAGLTADELRDLL
jgi:predicted RNA binding protein YcfA (HicA-like mRNA interferase family)